MEFIKKEKINTVIGLIIIVLFILSIKIYAIYHPVLIESKDIKSIEYLSQIRVDMQEWREVDCEKYEFVIDAINNIKYKRKWFEQYNKAGYLLFLKIKSKYKCIEIVFVEDNRALINNKMYEVDGIDFKKFLDLIE